MMSIPKLFAVGRNRRGIAAIEFAIISPVVVLMLFGAMEMTYVAAARASLESATITGGRMIAASDCPDTRKVVLRETIERGMHWVLSSDGQPPEIIAKAYGTRFGDVGQPEPFIDANGNGRYDPGESFTDVNGNGKWDADMGKVGSVGDAGEIISYETTFKVRSLVPFISAQFNGGEDHYVIRSTTIVRNEPIFRTTGCTS